jgi:hypothetical protein
MKPTKVLVAPANRGQTERFGVSEQLKCLCFWFRNVPSSCSCLRVGFSGSLLWGQATLPVAFQFLQELPRSQRASSVGTAPNRPKRGFHFSRPQELLPTGLAPGLAPSRHFQPSLGFGPPTVRGGAGPGPSRRSHHQPRPHRIQFRIAQRHPRTVAYLLKWLAPALVPQRLSGSSIKGPFVHPGPQARQGRA